MNTHLQRLSQRVGSDAFFLAAPLARYAASEGLDDDALAGRLGCDQDVLTLLRLCRTPDPLPPCFGRDVEAIATRFQLDAGRLAEIVRFGQALVQVQTVTDVTADPAVGFLMAAREEDDREPEAGENSDSPVGG